MRSSAMRDLMEITARPEVISLAGGLPDTSTFPPESFARADDADRPGVVGRGAPVRADRGVRPTKECIREVMAAEGMDPDPDDIIVTTGGQQAIDLVCKTLVDPGDVVIAEAPTYPGAVPVFCSYEAETIQVEMDSDGMSIEVLEACSTRSRRRGGGRSSSTRVPTFQNPAGQTLSAERRRRLVEIARERELLVVEDNPYGLLRYEGEPLPSRSTSWTAATTSLYLGTFSKILSPGIRLGWLCAPPPVMAKVVLGKQASDLCTSTLSQYFVARVLRRGPVARVRGRALRRLPRAPRRDARVARARTSPSQATWSRPEGGLFLWATLPSYIDTTDLLARALRENVAFVPGAAAFVDGRGARARCA